MNHARANFNNYDVSLAYVDMGKALHYIHDLGCPFHTSAAFGQAWHMSYEEWASNNWENGLETATDVNYFYIINDPSEYAKFLAGISAPYLDDICFIINLMWITDCQFCNHLEICPHCCTTRQHLYGDLVGITRELIAETMKFTIGMIVYATNFESPNTIGLNSVPISDNQISYVHIDNVAYSNRMLLPIRIDHTYIGDLEIWIGWKDDSSYTYTEVKIWNQEGGSADNLAINLWVHDFQNTHDWRLRVSDTAAGNEG